MDPSRIFSKLIHRSRSSIFFSATFFPKSYYQTILFGNQDADPETPEKAPDKKGRKLEPIEPYSIVLPSPFPRDNFKLVIHNRIKTTYKSRQGSYTKVARVIADTVTFRKGNYMVYFPSYAYMNDVVNIIEKEEDLPGITVQAQGMSENDREDFLNQFTQESQITGFAVMGGIFGEGIDLEGERLIGIIIVGVGLPQICPEQDQIRDYYTQRNEDGFFTAYQMPGFNRVLQATGRLIRTEKDKGVVVLIDERFTRKDYTDLFPFEWFPHDTIQNCHELEQHLADFWNSQESSNSVSKTKKE